MGEEVRDGGVKQKGLMGMENSGVIVGLGRGVKGLNGHGKKVQ